MTVSGNAQRFGRQQQLLKLHMKNGGRYAGRRTRQQRSSYCACCPYILAPASTGLITALTRGRSDLEWGIFSCFGDPAE